MRNYETLKNIYDLLANPRVNDLYRYTGCFEVSAMRLKRAQVIIKYLYPDLGKKADIAVMEEGGKWLYEGSNLDDGDILSCGCLCGNDVIWDSLCFLRKSPYWDIAIRSIYIGYEDEDIKAYEKGAAFFVKKELGEILEPGLFEEYGKCDKSPIDKIYSKYSECEDCEDEVCIIRCSLFPFIKKLMDVAAVDYPEEVKYLKDAVETVSSWLSDGEDYVFSTESNGYFCSWCGDFYGYGNAYVEFREEMIIAPEFIECIVFKLDEVYHVLPKEIGRRCVN